MMQSPLWFPVFFAAIWLGVTALLAYLSGWNQLAKDFPSDGTCRGEILRYASGSMGESKWFPVNYRNCLCFTIGDKGFELSMLFLFRFLSPPCFIPWPALESIEEETFLFVRQQVISIRGHSTKIKVRGKAGEKMFEAFKIYQEKHPARVLAASHPSQ